MLKLASNQSAFLSPIRPCSIISTLNIDRSKRFIEEAVRDLSPGIREATVRILESWVGTESEERLVRLLGEEEAKRLTKRIKGI